MNLLQRSLVAALAVSLAAVAPGCAARSEDDEDVAVSEADLDSEESFGAYDATEKELAEAEPGGAFENELTLYAIPAPKLFGLKWKRPGGLARRTLLNTGLKLSRSLGHAAVRVSCGGKTFTGSVLDTGDDFKTMVLEEKAGLGVLFRTVPGRLETAPELEKTLVERYENGRMSFLRFAITKDVCEDLLAYAQAFDAANVASQYGFVRPLYREGAGCSAFSMAFLQLAGLDHDRFRDAWSFDVRVPMSLIGGATNPGNEVSVLKLFTTFRPWARPDEAHMRLTGWDPTLMFTSIRGWAKEALARGEHVERRGKALGLVIDARSATPRAELVNRTFWAGNPGDPRTWWGFGDP